MSVEENMTLARRFMEARVKGDLDTVDELMAPDFVNHTALLSIQEPGAARVGYPPGGTGNSRASMPLRGTTEGPLRGSASGP